MLAVLFVLLACVASVSLAIQGEIISCSKCRLNALPEVRRFLKEVSTPGDRPFSRTFSSISSIPSNLLLFVYSGREPVDTAELPPSLATPMPTKSSR